MEASVAKRHRSIPRALADPRSAQAVKRPGPAKGDVLWFRAALAGVLLAVAVLGTIVVAGAHSSEEGRINHEVGALLAGIPQEGQTLGAPTAPVTLQLFAELEDYSSGSWFRVLLPAIIREFVRTNRLKIEYRAFKTNTISSETFVKQQAAALAAGAQDKLWNYIYAFSYEQGKERTPYATESFLDNIAHQVPALNIEQWGVDRNADPRIEQVVEEDQQGRADGIHATPAYRLGRTGGGLKPFAGSTATTYQGQYTPPPTPARKTSPRPSTKSTSKGRSPVSRARQARRKQTKKQRGLEEKAAERARTSGRKSVIQIGTAALGTVAIVIAGVLISTGITHVAGSSTQPSSAHVEKEVSALLGGIAQSGDTLGQASAPIMLQIFGDLESADVRTFVVWLLPDLIREWVRTNVVKIQYRSFIRASSAYPNVFVRQQDAALAAGAQDRLWNFIETFYHEQGQERTRYVTEAYLDNVARQAPGLNLSEWETVRENRRLTKQVIDDERAARATRFPDDPTFLIGRTGGRLIPWQGHRLYEEPSKRKVITMTTHRLIQKRVLAVCIGLCLLLITLAPGIAAACEGAGEEGKEGFVGFGYSPGELKWTSKETTAKKAEIKVVPDSDPLNLIKPQTNDETDFETKDPNKCFSGKPFEAPCTFEIKRKTTALTSLKFWGFEWEDEIGHHKYILATAIDLEGQ